MIRRECWFGHSIVKSMTPLLSTLYFAHSGLGFTSVLIRLDWWLPPSSLAKWRWIFFCCSCMIKHPQKRLNEWTLEYVPEGIEWSSPWYRPPRLLRLLFLSQNPRDRMLLYSKLRSTSRRPEHVEDLEPIAPELEGKLCTQVNLFSL